TPFTPDAGHLIASAISGTGYPDTGVTYGTVYYYIVRAADTSGGQEDGNLIIRSGTPTGVISTAMLETFEGAGGFDHPGWTHNPIMGSLNWVLSSAISHSATHSWFAQDGTAVSDKVIVTPAFGVTAGSTISFWHTYAFEGGA